MKKIWTNVAHSFKEAEEFDRKFWKQAGSHARFAAACQILKDYFKMKGKDGRSLRLRRDVLKIKRMSSRPHDRED